MNNFINKFKQNKDTIFIVMLSMLSLVFIGGYMFLKKGLTDLSIVLCYIIAIVLPMYNILNNKNTEDDDKIDYIIASISSIFIIVYTIFSLISK